MNNTFASPWTILHHAPLFMRFSGEEYWSGLPLPSPEDLPDPGIKLVLPGLLHWRWILYHWDIREDRFDSYLLAVRCFLYYFSLFTFKVKDSSLSWCFCGGWRRWWKWMVLNTASHHAVRSGNQFSSVAQLYPTLCDPMNHSMTGLPVHHWLPESTQNHTHWLGDAILPSHPLLSPSPPALNLYQHQGLFQWVSSLHQVAKILEFQLQNQSFQWTLKH